MIAGLNHNLRHKGKLYHVQTESRSTKDGVFIESQVFVDGAVVFQNRMACDADEEEQGRILEQLHKKSIYNIFMGIKEESVKPRMQTQTQLNPSAAEEKKAAERPEPKPSAPTPPPIIQKIQPPPIKKSIPPDIKLVESKEEPQTRPENLAAKLPPKPQQPRIVENRVAMAQEILAELSASRSLSGLGVFSGDGKIVSMVSTSKGDLAEISQSYLQVFASLEKINETNKMGESSSIHIASENGSIVVLSFKPFLKDLSAHLQGALAYVMLRLEPNANYEETLQKARAFMKLISDELKFYSRESASRSSVIRKLA